MEESGLPRSSAVRNQSGNGTSSPFEVDDALTVGLLRSARTPARTPDGASEETHEHRAADPRIHHRRRLVRTRPADRRTGHGRARGGGHAADVLTRHGATPASVKPR